MKTFTFRKSALVGAMTLVAPLSYAEIELNPNLTVSGFVDMSFVHSDVDGVEPTSKTFAVDQVETNFFYTGTDGVTAQVDIEYGESGDGSGADETFVEQAFITKEVGGGLSIKAGRFLSYSGWETEEPTGLFQYSGTGYAPVFYGFYQQGVSAYYDAGMVDVAFSVVNDVFADPTESDTTTLGTEFMVAVNPIEAWTAKLFYLSDADKDAINFWTSYAVSDFTFAFEYNVAEGTVSTDSDASGFLLMGNYAVGDFGITARYHEFEVENAEGETVTDASAFTIAPSYAVGDNLLLVAEYRIDTEDSTDTDANTIALEALFTF